jgi:F0F1-type ATP synthase membrane subunit c/vacuolar-type H+-ATPase subunit K
MNRNLALILIFTLCILGPSAVIAASGFASINALGRNPSSAPKIFTAMIITLVFAEAIAIIALLVLFQLFRIE